MTVKSFSGFAVAALALVLTGAGCASQANNVDTNSGDQVAVAPAVSESQSGDTMMDKKGDTMMDDKDMMDKDTMAKDTMQKSETTVETPVASNNQPIAQLASAGEYVEYSDSALDNLGEDGAVLFFHASFCSSCNAADKQINAEAASIPEDLTIVKVDYESETELKQKYGVTTYHSFVQVDKDGNMVKKWLGSRNLNDIVRQI